jgi:hypothetical protein
VQHLGDRLGVAAGEESERLVDAFGRPQQTVALRIFTDAAKNLPN